jgi:hypothetical protein
LVFFLIFLKPTYALTYLYSCVGNLAPNEDYILANDVYPIYQSCFYINSNSSLDLNGHTIFLNAPYNVGIATTYGDNITIKNGRIYIGVCGDDWSSGISIQASSNMKIENMVIFHPECSGGNYRYLIGEAPVGSNYSYNITINNVNLTSLATSGTVYAIRFDSARNSKVTNTVITTYGNNPNSWDIYFDSPTQNNYVCAEFNTSRVVNNGYNNNINYCPYTPPQHVSLTKYCESWGNPGEIYGWFACSPEDIGIPSNAVNVTSSTTTYMTVYNATYEGNASCSFTIQSCNYPLGYLERCGYRQTTCTGAFYSMPYTYYGTIFGGQTVRSSGSVTVPEGCIIYTGYPARLKVTVQTHVEYDLVTLPPTKSATLYVEPKTGNKTTIFYFHLLTSNLMKPYNASLYIDSRWQATHYNIYDDTLTVEMVFGENTGSHTIYFVVRDSEGTEITTNTEEVYVGAGGMQPFTLTVIPTTGDVFTSFSFQTSEIRGGTAPYTVELYHGASIFVGKCEGVPEGGICSKSELLPCGYRNAFAIAKDSAGNQMISNFVPVNVTCAPMGETLNVTLTMTPTTGNSQTIFNLTFTIRGGAPPYRVTWLEWGNPLCSDEIYTRSPPFSVTERWKFPAGSRGISLSVRSADGQVAPSNLLTFDVAWAGETNFTSYDCTGTLGAWVQRGAEVPPAPYVPSYEPVINRTLFTQAGADWMAFFFTPIFFATLMLVGISGFITLAIAKYGGGQFAPAAFIIISMIMIAIYGMSGIYPTWLVIVLIILAGFVFAKFVLGVI